MGQGALAGMPLQLAGTRKILEFMDWGDYGAMDTFIKIGSIGTAWRKWFYYLSFNCLFSYVLCIFIASSGSFQTDSVFYLFFLHEFLGIWNQLSFIILFRSVLVMKFCWKLRLNKL